MSDPVETFEVIVNEDQHCAIWPQCRSVPEGWRLVGRSGSRDELLAYLRDTPAETLPMPLLITNRQQLETGFGWS